jgi:signal transduction histidine kinase
LLRVVQEALSNIARHSGATEISIQTTTLNLHTAGLIIIDNGRGFDPETPAVGMGLTNMRERVAALADGHFHIQSAPGKGTCIEIQCSTRLETSETADGTQPTNGVLPRL